MSEVLISIEVYEDDFASWDKGMSQEIVIDTDKSLQDVLDELVDKCQKMEVS